MRRDAIAEPYTLGRLLNPEHGEMVISDWVRKYVHQCSARHYTDLVRNKKAAEYQKHIDERLIFELTSKVISDCSIDQIDETETKNIKTKTVFVIGDKK